MRTRSIKKQFWLNKNEATQLKNKAKKVGMNESTLIRNLIVGFQPKEKPDDRFYDYLKLLRSISNNINQIARRANLNGFIDENDYNRESKRINEFILNIKNEYLFPSNEEL